MSWYLSLLRKSVGFATLGVFWIGYGAVHVLGWITLCLIAVALGLALSGATIRLHGSCKWDDDDEFIDRSND